MFSATLDDLSWAEIKQLGDSGKASQVFSVGDKKSMTIKFASGEVSQPSVSYQGKTVHAQIVGFSIDKKTSGDMAPITFITEEIAGQLAQYSSYEWGDGGYLRDFLQNNRSTILPDELNAVIANVSKRSVVHPDNIGTEFEYNAYSDTNDYLFIPSATETLGFNYKEEPNQVYPYFSGSSRLIKKNDGIAVEWITRSSYSAGPTQWVAVRATGTHDYINKNEMNYFPLGFCI